MSDKIEKNLIRLLFAISLLTTGFDLDELTHFAGRIRRMIKLGLSINDDHEDFSDDDNTVPERVEGAADKTSKMKE
eukprot:16245727-Heterocapsa_arctica.AAC.1